MRTTRLPVLVAAVALAASPFLLTSCVVPSPSPGPNAALDAVAAVNGSSAWAVGSFTDRTGQHELMEHWNGKSWQTVFLPAPIGKRLSSITVTIHNVWAVSERRTLLFGGHAWRSVANPAGTAMYRVASGTDAAVYGLGHTASADTLLLMTAGGWRSVTAIPTATSPQSCDVSKGATDLAVLKAGDVWIVGNGIRAGSTQTCIAALHWDGTTWQSSALPGLPGAGTLSAVSARAANDVWAVGWTATYDQQVGRSFDRSLVLRWNGTKWAVVPSIDKPGEGALHDIDATGDGVWAVGVGFGFPRWNTAMLIKKWTGTSMVDQAVQQLPMAGGPSSVTTYTGYLTGVSVRGGVVTSVGGYIPRSGVGATLIERRNAN